jgi:hypothetical protein
VSRDQMSVTRGPATAIVVTLASLALAGAACADSTLKSTPPVALPSSAPASKSTQTVNPNRGPAPQPSGPLPRTGFDASLEILAGSPFLAIGVGVRIVIAPPS